MPIMQRAKVDLPEPEGPSTTVTVPGSTAVLTPLRMGLARPGAVATTSRNVKAPFGATRDSAGSRSGWSRSSASSRSNAARAPTKPRHVPTSMSIGASARDISTLAAIMPPGDNWPSITSSAPAPRASDCCV